MSCDFYCGYTSNHSYSAHIVYGPDIQKIDDYKLTDRVIWVGNQTFPVIKMLPKKPFSHLDQMEESNEFCPDKPRFPANLKQVFWVRTPYESPRYSINYPQIDIIKVWSDQSKSEYIPLLLNSIFVSDP